MQKIYLIYHHHWKAEGPKNIKSGYKLLFPVYFLSHYKAWTPLNFSDMGQELKEMHFISRPADYNVLPLL